MLHTEYKAEWCLKCLEVGYNMTKCRVELQHQDPSGTKRISVGTTCSEHEVATFNIESSTEDYVY